MEEKAKEVAVIYVRSCIGASINNLLQFYRWDKLQDEAKVVVNEIEQIKKKRLG